LLAESFSVVQLGALVFDGHHQDAAERHARRRPRKSSGLAADY
jgi:hypothetical protein